MWRAAPKPTHAGGSPPVYLYCHRSLRVLPPPCMYWHRSVRVLPPAASKYCQHSQHVLSRQPPCIATVIQGGNTFPPQTACIVFAANMYFHRRQHVLPPQPIYIATAVCMYCRRCQPVLPPQPAGIITTASMYCHLGQYALPMQCFKGDGSQKNALLFT